MEKHHKILKKATEQTQDQIENNTKTYDPEKGGNMATQIVEFAMDDPNILARKTFSVTSGIMAKGILINQRGQRSWAW